VGEGEVASASRLFGQRYGQPLSDLLPQGRRAPGATVMELTVEGGHHPGGIVAGEGGQHGGERPFLDGADFLGSGCGGHVLRISM